MLIAMISIFIDLIEEEEFQFFTTREILNLIEYVINDDNDDNLFSYCWYSSFFFHFTELLIIYIYRGDNMIKVIYSNNGEHLQLLLDLLVDILINAIQTDISGGKNE